MDLKTQETFKIYKSSAGSGKTFTLVKEYLALALSEKLIDKHPHILAITFTNKAANEMKERILEYLHGLKIGSNEGAIPVIRNLLCAEIKIDELEIQNRASICLSKILHNYTHFNISTIDKFLISVVRTFSNDLFLNASFEVNLDKEEVIDQAIQELLDQVGTNKDITKVLSEFVEFNSDNDKSWKVEKEIANYSRLLFSDEAHQFIQKLKSIPIETFIAFKKDLTKKQKIKEAELVKIGKAGLELEDRLGGNKIYAGHGKASAFFGHIKNANISKIIPSASLLKNIDKGQVLKKDFSESENQEMLDFLTQSIDQINLLKPEIVLFDKISKGLFALAVLKEIESIVDDLKEEKNFVPISEFNQKIFDIVSNEPIPFIYERYGNRFKHIMIDEFQDTSVLQWQNLLPLVENALSEGFKNMVVGDTKQAIYRFRGGDVEQFAKLPLLNNKESLADAAIKEQTLVNSALELNLDTNFRSSKSVVEFNNELFAMSSERLGDQYTRIYKGHEQKVASSTEGYVELIKIDKGDKELIFEQLLTQVEDCLERKFRQKDLSILVRSGNEGKEIAQVLNEAGYDVISNESFLLSKSPNVNLIIATLQYIHDSEPIQNQLRMIDLAHLASESALDLSDLHFRFLKEKNLNAVLKELNFNLNLKDLQQFSLYEKVEAIIALFKLDTRDANIIQLLDVVFNFTNKQSTYLLDFLQWWDNKKDRLNVIIPESLDAIQILTIHKSKGLEFPVVIYPFAFSDSKLHKSNIWFSNEDADIPYNIFSATEDLLDTLAEDVFKEEQYKYQLETLNVMYVALTRAARELYVYTKKSNLKSIKLEQHFLCDFIESKGDGEQFAIGKKEIIEQLEATQNKQQIEFSANNWRKNIAVAYQNPSSKTVSPESSYGVQIHEVLSLIDTDLNIQKAIQSCIDKELIELDKCDKIKQDIEQLLDKDELKEVFTAKDYYNEREILTDKGKILRPDKLIFKDGEWLVIDFKSGEKVEKNEHQVRSYIHALESMNKKARGFLLYIETAELLEV